MRILVLLVDFLWISRTPHPPSHTFSSITTATTLPPPHLCKVAPFPVCAQRLGTHAMSCLCCGLFFLLCCRAFLKHRDDFGYSLWQGYQPIYSTYSIYLTLPSTDTITMYYQPTGVRLLTLNKRKSKSKTQDANTNTHRRIHSHTPVTYATNKTVTVSTNRLRHCVQWVHALYSNRSSPGLSKENKNIWKF